MSLLLLPGMDPIPHNPVISRSSPGGIIASPYFAWCSGNMEKTAACPRGFKMVPRYVYKPARTGVPNTLCRRDPHVLVRVELEPTFIFL